MDKCGYQHHVYYPVKNLPFVVTGKVQWRYNLILPDLWNLNIKYIDSNILKSKYFQKSNSDI